MLICEGPGSEYIFGGSSPISSKEVGYAIWQRILRSVHPIQKDADLGIFGDSQ